MPKPTDPEKATYQFSDDMKFLVKCVVFHPTDSTRFLTLKRSENARKRPGHWDFPGGNLLFGELHEAALRREIEEETKLHVDAPRPLHVVTNFDGRYVDMYFLYIGFGARAQSDEIALSHEHSEYKWVTAEEFMKMTTDEEEFLRETVQAL